MDLCGPIPIQSLGRSKYILVIVDDFAQFTWFLFLREKDEAFKELAKIYKQAKSLKIHRLFSLEVIMVENLTKINSLNFVVIMTLLITFLRRKHLNKMG